MQGGCTGLGVYDLTINKLNGADVAMFLFNPTPEQNFLMHPNLWRVRKNTSNLHLIP